MAQKRVKKYDYIKRSDISVLKATVDGKVLNVDPKKILSGTYVAGKITPTAKKLRVAKIDPFKLKEKIIARAKEVLKEDYEAEYEKFVLAKDLKAFIECGLTEKMIMAFYLGFKAVVKVTTQGEYADYGDSGGIFGYRTDGGYIERAIERAIYNCENKCFEIGFKYPDFNWKKAGMKVSKTEVVTTPEYEFMGKNRKDVIKVETFTVKTNFKVLAVKKEATLMENKVAVVDPKVPLELNGGYLALVSRNAKDLFALATKLLTQENSYTKDFDWLIQTKTDGARTLNESGFKYAKGGFIMPVTNLTNKYSYLKRDLSSIKGDVEVRIEKRNLKGLSGSQDPYDMIIYQKGKKIATFGTHPSQSGAEKMLKNLKRNYAEGGKIKTLNDIKETFAKGNRLAKLELDDSLVYWFDLKDLRIEHTKWGYHSNRQPLYYDSEKAFYDSVKRILAKQKSGSTYAKGGGVEPYEGYEEDREEMEEEMDMYIKENDFMSKGGGVPHKEVYLRKNYGYKGKVGDKLKVKNYDKDLGVIMAYPMGSKDVYEYEIADISVLPIKSKGGSTYANGGKVAILDTFTEQGEFNVYLVNPKTNQPYNSFPFDNTNKAKQYAKENNITITDKGGQTYAEGGEVRVLKDIDSTYHKDNPKKGDILIVRDLEKDINYWETEDDKVPESVTAWYKGRGNEYMLGEEVEFIDNGKLSQTYFDKGGRIETLTRLNGNRQEYTLPLPKIVVLSRNINDVALDWIKQNTGLTLKKTVWAYEAQPKTSAQIVKLLTMSGTPLIQFQNNATNKNVLFMKYYRDDFLQYKKGGEVEKANMGMLMAADKLKGLAPKSFDAADTKIANKVSKKSFSERMSQTGNEEFDKDAYQANTEFAKGGGVEVFKEYPHYAENGFRDKAELRKELEYLIQSIYDRKKYINQSKAYSKRAYKQRGMYEQIERSAAYWDNERAEENEALRRARSNYEDAFGEKKYVPFFERYAKGGSLGDARYIPQHQLLNVKLKNGKVIENSFNNPIYSGLRIGEAINEQEEMEAMGQMRLFKQGGRMPKYATYISARDIDKVYFGDEDDPQEVRGSELKNGIWYDNESGARLVEFAKSKGYLK